MKRILSFAFALFILFPYAFAQEISPGNEQLLTARKWTITTVKGKHHTLLVGDELQLNKNYSFTYKSTDSSVAGGTWKLSGDELQLVIESFMEAKIIKIPAVLQIKKLNENELILKFSEGESRGKIYFR